jgi:hypothetical protein
VTSLRDLLVAWQFWGLELLFGLVIVTTLVEVWRLGISRFVVAGACVLAVLAGVFTASVPPQTSRIYYDEQIYQGIARNMSDLHLAQMCNEGTVEYGRLTCSRSEYNKQPYGYPYLISVAYRAFGVSDVAAFRINNVVAGLAVLVTVLLAELLFRAGWASLFAGLLLALLPMQATWSNTAAAEPSAALLCGAAVLAVVHYTNVRTVSALAWTIALAAFALTLRPECVLVLPLVAVAIALFAPDEFGKGRLWRGALAGLPAAIVPLLHLIAVREEGWGATGSRMSWQYAQANAPANFWFYFGDERFPLLVGLAAVVGLVSLERPRQRLMLFAYWLAFWIVFVFFYAGSYNYGADVRFSLMTHIPIVIAGSLGLARVAAWLQSRWPAHRWIAAAVPVAVVGHLLNYVPLVRATGEEAWAARADVAYAKGFAQQLPPNSIVLTHNPSMFHVWGANAAQLSIAQTDRAYVEREWFSRYAGGVYLHWNFWCNVNDPRQTKFCRDVLESFPHVRIAEAREREYVYALYRLERPAD